MTGGVEDELRRALGDGASRFTPAAAIGATRRQVVARVRRRQRQLLSLSGAALLVCCLAAVALAGRVGGSAPSRQVAARGAQPVATNASPPGGGGTATSSPSPSPVTTAQGSGPTTSAPPATARPLPPATTAPATSLPPATSVPRVSEVRGTVRFGPVCPVESVPPNPACAPRPGAAHIELLRADLTVAASGDAGAGGDFAIPVAPGHYLVHATALPASPIGAGCSATPADVTVVAGTASTVAVLCDTGIR